MGQGNSWAAGWAGLGKVLGEPLGGTGDFRKYFEVLA